MSTRNQGWGPGQSSSRREAEVFEACWRLYQTGESDLLDGGVAVPTIAQWLGVSQNSVRQICRRLADQGHLRRVDGAVPETLEPRPSYIPVALDGGEQQ